MNKNSYAINYSKRYPSNYYGHQQIKLAYLAGWDRHNKDIIIERNSIADELDKGIKLMFDKHNEILLHQADAYILFKKLAKGLRTSKEDVNTTIQEDCGNSKELRENGK